MAVPFSLFCLKLALAQQCGGDVLPSSGFSGRPRGHHGMLVAAGLGWGLPAVDADERGAPRTLRPCVRRCGEALAARPSGLGALHGAWMHHCATRSSTSHSNGGGGGAGRHSAARISHRWRFTPPDPISDRGLPGRFHPGAASISATLTNPAARRLAPSSSPWVYVIQRRYPSAFPARQIAPYSIELALRVPSVHVRLTSSVTPSSSRRATGRPAVATPTSLQSS